VIMLQKFKPNKSIQLAIWRGFSGEAIQVQKDLEMEEDQEESSDEEEQEELPQQNTTQIDIEAAQPEIAPSEVTSGIRRIRV